MLWTSMPRRLRSARMGRFSTLRDAMPRSLQPPAMPAGRLLGLKRFPGRLFSRTSLCHRTSVSQSVSRSVSQSTRWLRLVYGFRGFGRFRGHAEACFAGPESAPSFASKEFSDDVLRSLEGSSSTNSATKSTPFSLSPTAKRRQPLRRCSVVSSS